MLKQKHEKQLKSLCIHDFPHHHFLSHFALQIHSLKTFNQVLVGYELDAAHLYIIIFHLFGLMSDTLQTQMK